MPSTVMKEYRARLRNQEGRTREYRLIASSTEKAEQWFKEFCEWSNEIIESIRLVKIY